MQKRGQRKKDEAQKHEGRGQKISGQKTNKKDNNSRLANLSFVTHLGAARSGITELLRHVYNVAHALNKADHKKGH